MRVRVIAIVLLALVTACSADRGSATTDDGGSATTTTGAVVSTTVPVESLADIARGVAPRPDGEAHTFSLEDAWGFEVDLPTTWTDRENGIWIWFDDADVGRWVMGSTHIPSWETAWGVAGVFVAASSDPDMLALGLDEFLFLPWLEPDECESTQRFGYDDGRFTGAWDLYDDCEGSVFVVFGFTAADGSHVMYAQVTVETDADYEVLDQIVSSFRITGSLEP